jgi:ketosteroid isomerase-like protein
VSDRQGGGVAIVPPTSNGNAPTTTAIPPTAAPTPTTKPPVPTPGNGRAEPRPEAPPEPARDTAKVDVPPPRVDNVEIAKKEIRQWMNEYAAAYKALDAVRVRAMNPATIFRPALYKSAAVSFFNAEIVPAENGQRAVLHVDVQYDYEFKRGSPPAPLRSRVAWTMRKTPTGWVANPN